MREPGLLFRSKGRIEVGLEQAKRTTLPWPYGSVAYTRQENAGFMPEFVVFRDGLLSSIIVACCSRKDNFIITLFDIKVFQVFAERIPE